jgi:excisionase family DNA binding protein
MSVLASTTALVNPPTVDSPYMNKLALAKFLGVSTRTVDRLKDSGALTFTRVGHQVRFSWHDIIRFLAKNEVSSIA